MEGQQPDPDDVTAEHGEDGAPTVALAADGAAAAPTLGNRRPRRSPGAAPRGKRQRRRSAGATALLEHPEGAPDTDADPVGLGQVEGELAPAPRRLNRWSAALVAVAAVAFVGSMAFAGASVHTYLADRASAAARTEVARAAVAAVTTLWTYTPQTVDTLADRAEQYLSGDFNAQYRKFLNAAAMPNRQAQVTNSTEVVGAGVESVDGSDAVAIVFTNTTATSPLTQNVPSLKYVGYRLTMKREDSRWLVAGMSTVSFTDLTPQL